MPNGNRTYFLKRSQPPYVALMADDVYRETGDGDFLRAAFGTLKKEYEFWMTYRVSPNGLNRYGSENDEADCAAFYNDCVVGRLGRDETREAVEAGRHYLAEAESGWDFTPRFDGHCADFNPVDLNCNLYIYEKLFAEYEEKFGWGDGEVWKEKAGLRRKKINALLWDGASGCYRDYNYRTGKLSEVVSAASFQPYFAEVAGEEQAGGLKGLFKTLESEWGVFTAVRTKDKRQWGYPNLWAPCQYLACEALRRYGLEAESVLTAKRYLKLIEKNFAGHGKLFEKYNGETGNIDAVSEYGTPEMLGWTAGVYLFFRELFADRGVIEGVRQKTGSEKTNA